MNTRPSKGTIISVEPFHFTTLKTNEPVIRITYDGTAWVPVHPDEKRGYIVFIRHPKEVIHKISAVMLVSATSRVAFAIAENYK